MVFPRGVFESRDLPPLGIPITRSIFGPGIVAFSCSSSGFRFSAPHSASFGGCSGGPSPRRLPKRLPRSHAGTRFPCQTASAATVFRRRGGARCRARGRGPGFRVRNYLLRAVFRRAGGGCRRDRRRGGGFRFENRLRFIGAVAVRAAAIAGSARSGHIFLHVFTQDAWGSLQPRHSEEVPRGLGEARLPPRRSRPTSLTSSSTRLWPPGFGPSFGSGRSRSRGTGSPSGRPSSGRWRTSWPTRTRSTRWGTSARPSRRAWRSSWRGRGSGSGAEEDAVFSAGELGSPLGRLPRGDGEGAANVATERQMSLEAVENVRGKRRQEGGE